MAGKLFMTGLLVLGIAVVLGLVGSEISNKRLEKLANFTVAIAFVLGVLAGLFKIWL